MALLTNRESARHAGYARYQGEPCTYGHDGIRYIKNNCCVRCADLHTARCRGNQSALKSDQSNFAHPVMVFGDPARVQRAPPRAVIRPFW